MSLRSISANQAAFRLGVARDNSFGFYITPPEVMFKGLGQLGGDFLNKIPFGGKLNIPSIASASVRELIAISCKSISGVNRAFNEITTSVNGTQEYQLGSDDYDTFSCEFYDTPQKFVEQFFISWQNLVMNPTNKYRHFRDEYAAPRCNLIEFDLNGQALSPSQETIFHMVTPTQVSKPLLDHMNDGLYILTVTFRFKRMNTGYDENFKSGVINRTIRGLVNKAPTGGITKLISGIG